MHAAVDHVHHRHRQHPSLLAAEVAEERDARLRGRRLRRRERDAEHGVRAEAALVRRPVELDQQPVEAGLVGCVAAARPPRRSRPRRSRPPASRPCRRTPRRRREARPPRGRRSTRRTAPRPGRARRTRAARRPRRSDCRASRRSGGRGRSAIAVIRSSPWRGRSIGPGRRAADAPIHARLSAAARRSASSTRATKRSGRLAQLELRIGVETAGDVHAGEEEVAELGGAALCGSAGQLGLQLGELVLEVGERAVEVRVLEPDRRRPPLHLARVQQRGQRVGDVVEDAFAPLLLALDLVPLPAHGAGSVSASTFAEDVRVAPDELFMDVRERPARDPLALLRQEQGQEVDLEEEIAELVEELRRSSASAASATS